MSGVYWQSIRDLLRRYRDVFGVAWSERHGMEIPRHLAHEAAFLPAHLELMETPVHPAPRWTMRVIALAAVLALLISVIGKLDIVVVASGELIPDSNVKVIQPAVTGVVRQILVHDGQRVVAGQPLIRLDTRQAAADASTARASRVHSALAMSRAQALLDGVASNRAPIVVPVADASALEQQQSANLASQTWQAYIDKRHDAEALLAARAAELDGTRQEISKLQATAPLARQQAEVYASLALNKDVAQTDYLDREQTARNQEHEIDAQRAHATQLSATINQQKAALAGITSEFLRDQRLDLEKNTQLFNESRDQETKATTRQALLTLSAPVTGTVQQLAVHTLGGVVTTAQAVMEVVPGDTLQVKATIENRDVGFVREGQPVVVKVAAFPYTHYGYLTGKVVELSNDAAQDRRRGSVFVAYVQLSGDRISVDGRPVTLSPGMAVSAEITTGRRRVISYFLGPLVAVTKESLRER
jgi:hemolysin D